MYNDLNFILSTANNLEGFHVIKQCGVVFGETVFRHSFMDSISAGFSDLKDSFSLESTELTGSVNLIEKARNYAYNKMIEQAKRKGANAVIAIDSDNTIGKDIMYISLYGTAVYVLNEDEYEAYLKSNKEKKELAKKKAQEEAQLKEQREKEFMDRIARNEFTKGELFLQGCQEFGFDSYRSFYDKWQEYELDSIYPETTEVIKSKVSFEKMYGKSRKDVERFINQLKEQPLT